MNGPSFNGIGESFQAAFQVVKQSLQDFGQAVVKFFGSRTVESEPAQAPRADMAAAGQAHPTSQPLESRSATPLPVGQTRADRMQAAQEPSTRSGNVERGARNSGQPVSTFNNYKYQGLTGGVCHGATVTWLNTMARGDLPGSRSLQGTPAQEREIQRIQRSVESGSIDPANMVESGTLSASRYDPFGASNFMLQGHVDLPRTRGPDGRFGEDRRAFQSGQSTDQAFGDWARAQLAQPGDFAFVNISSDGSSAYGHACAIIRGEGDSIHFFNPDRGMYEFDMSHLQELKQLLNSTVGSRNQCALVPGHMAPGGAAPVSVAPADMAPTGRAAAKAPGLADVLRGRETDFITAVAAIRKAGPPSSDDEMTRAMEAIASNPAFNVPQKERLTSLLFPQ